MEKHKIYGYNTHSSADRKSMLNEIGLENIDALFSDVPEALRLKRALNLPDPLPEWELEKDIAALAATNDTTKTHLNFMGGGMYEHHIPAVIDSIARRSEYFTAYTPYQPEISQGMLQTLYEYQLAITCITGNPVVNGSCYDGATAMADAAWVSCCIATDNPEKIAPKNDVILVSQTMWQSYRKVIATYMSGREVEVRVAPTNPKTGQIDQTQLADLFKTVKPHGFLFQSPNCFGVLEEVQQISQLCQQHEVVSAISWNPLCSGLLTPPGEANIGIVTCEGQPLGIPLNAGGPSIGVFATAKPYRQYIPGRLVGKVYDINGNPAYALVFEEREQQVAREKATSNICSNQALNAVRAILYLSLLGDTGLTRLATLNVKKARYLQDGLSKINGIELPFPGNQKQNSFFNEFTVLLPRPVQEVLQELHQQGIFGGIDISTPYQEATGSPAHAMLIAVTEVKSKAELDRMTQSLAELI